jgi:hypothetical protein
MAFLTKKGSIIKTNDDPSEYFQRVIEKYGNEDALKKQNIPTEKSLWSYENYELFLNARSEMIVTGITKLIDSLK